MSASVVDHPLVRHHLTDLRNVETSSDSFRNLVHKLTTLLAFDATKPLTEKEKTIATPLCEMSGHELDQRIALVPILRAGLGMVDPILSLIPNAEVRHLGFYRDEETAQPVEYYNKLPAENPPDVALILDPMLATGGSAIAACQTLQNWGVRKLSLLSILAAPEGIAAVQKAIPSINVFVCAIDERLNEQKFIVPGLGDAGDRIFNTQA